MKDEIEITFNDESKLTNEMIGIIYEELKNYTVEAWINHILHGTEFPPQEKTKP